MNKYEKIICAILGAILGWYIFGEMSRAKTAAQSESVSTATNVAAVATVAQPVVEPIKPTKVEAAKPSVPEKVKTLENALVKVEVTSWGAAVKRVTLKRYARDCGEVNENNPAVTLDYGDSPMGAAAQLEAFEIRDWVSNSVVFVNAKMARRITLGDDYTLRFEDTPIAAEGFAADALSIGMMKMGDSKNDLLSVDSWALDAGRGKEGVLHHCEGDSPLKTYLVGGLSGGCSGCSGSSGAANLPPVAEVQVAGSQKWIVLKNRFFVTALVSADAAVNGFATTIARDMKSASYRPDSVSIKATLAGGGKRTLVFFAGPKKQALLWDLGMKDVMEFGMWRWLCYPLVWVLNFFNDFIPNYGIAIILLTILVRILFWPLTRKSTIGMKKMQELQPKMKEIQTKFKDNPQRLQQETWALYKSEKVNPMSSCLPMLIQIPVFIALFNVLRSAVELRYAPFLWIADLSEPEGLLAAYLPFGGLNILPILMAVSTGLQSYFTPSAGDKSQQKMMMIMMPAMMLVMFYSFPSALSLYWFLSNLFSIVQMYFIRRASAKEQQVLHPEVIDPPVTRQMRRHS